MRHPREIITQYIKEILATVNDTNSFGLYVMDSLCGDYHRMTITHRSLATYSISNKTNNDNLKFTFESPASYSDNANKTIKIIKTNSFNLNIWDCYRDKLDDDIKAIFMAVEDRYQQPLPTIWWDWINDNPNENW